MGQSGAVEAKAVGSHDKEYIPWFWEEKRLQSLQKDGRVVRQRLHLHIKKKVQRFATP